MEFHIMAIKKSSGSGIPFGNNAGRPANPGTGQLYSNGEAARLELYTSANAWENIVQEVPGVASIGGQYLETNNSNTIIIYGTNFVSGATAFAIGTNAVEVAATSTTFNSLVQLTAVFTGLTSANEPYDIKVVNPSNLFGILPDSLFVNNQVAWTTSAGSLGTFADQVAISVSAVAADDSTITYAVASGSTLPSGLTLNSSTGLLSGTLADVNSNTTYTFTLTASDGSNPAVARQFSILINAAPVWVTSAGSLGSFLNNTTIATSALSVTDSDTFTYALASGSTLPLGLTLNSSTGVVSGTLPVVSSDTTYTFTINANDGLNVVPRAFSISSMIINGTSEVRAFTSKASMSALASGTYWVKLPGMSAAAETYFDNSNAGGGWLLTFTVTNANGKLVNWFDNDSSMTGNTGNTPNYFTATGTLGSTATLAKSNAKNEIFNGYVFTETMIMENHNGTVGRKAYGLNATKSYRGWFTDIATHDTFTNRVSSLLSSSGTMSAFTTSELDFNLQLSGAPGDGGRLVPNGPFNECVGGIATRTDGVAGYGSYGWSGNLLRNDSNRAYGVNGSTVDHTAWVFVR
jgi:hypothetical protein